MASLNWSSDPAELVAAHGTFDVLLGADLVYSSGCVAVLARAVRALLRPTGGTLLLCSPSGRHGLLQFTAVPRCANHGPAASPAPSSCPPALRLPPNTPRRSQALEAEGLRCSEEVLEAELLRDAACQGEDAEVVAHPFLLLRAVLPPADTVPECVERAGVRRSETLIQKT